MATYDSGIIRYDDPRFTYDGDLAPRVSTGPLRVRIGFDLSANGVADFFTLDDPVKGELDNVTYTLVADVLVDVTDYVRQVSTKRGRSRTLERYTPGAANFTLDNRDRAYDPTNTHGIYYGQLVPRKQVIVDYGGVNLFTGFVEDWNFGYSVGGDAVAEPSCTDGFALLAPTILTAGTATAQGTGARVTAVLDAIDWPAGKRSIATGDATLAADVVGDSTEALAYLQKVELSENGALFMNRDGGVTFRSRTQLQTFSTDVVIGIGGIPFNDISVVYGTEEMTNTATVTYPAGTATATSATAVTAYGLMAATYDTLLADATQAQDMADYIVATYAQPIYRVDTLRFVVDGLGDSDRGTLMQLELGDIARVAWRPNDLGEAISQYVTVDAIEHAASPAGHEMTLTLSQTNLGFLLDSATRGVLDTSALGF